MDNDNTQPLLVAGKLSKECYESLQDFVDELPSVLKFPIDAVSVIQGAAGTDGAKGAKGDTGAKGSKGDTGEGVILDFRMIDIANAAKYVDFPIFDGWENAVYTIRHKGQIGSTDPLIVSHNPSTEGVVGVGIVIALYLSPLPTTIRCYFVYAGGPGGGIVAVPDAFHFLQISSYK
jgi:hypothetical protein